MLRFWQLGNVPPSPDWDEAALGYNAYSIMLTGKDEYGISFPLRLKSFGDYKMPLYSYLSIPFIATFGLSESSTRMLNTLIAILFIAKGWSGFIPEPNKITPFTERT